MKYPFSKAETYFTAAEQKHLDVFLESEPIPKDTWRNDKGETRKVMRVDFPEGIDFGKGRSAYWTDPKTKIVWYHSPCATLPSKMARVMYADAKGSGVCNSEEWIKWSGKSFTVEKPKIVPKTEAQIEKEKALMGMAARSTAPPETADEFSKGAKWSKPRK